jgi:hypothetical protein
MPHSANHPNGLVDLGSTTINTALTCIYDIKCQSEMDAKAAGYQSVMGEGIPDKECSLARQGGLADDTQ